MLLRFRRPRTRHLLKGSISVTGMQYLQDYLCKVRTMLSEEAKDRLRQTLDKVHEWPSVYMFKFIFEPEEERLNAVIALFPAESEILRKYSAGGKYLSITVKEVMMNAEDVVARYVRASEITGIIVL